MNSFSTTQARISEATAAEQRAHEPSMEEILASIRRIIADDQMLPLTRPAREPEAAAPAVEAPAVEASAPRVETPPAIVEPAAAPVAEAPANVELVSPVPEVSIAPPPRQTAPAIERRVEAPQRPVRMEQPAPRGPVAAPIAIRPEPVREAPRQEPGPLLSPEMGASVSSAFNALATTMVLQNQGMVEEATRELLRPMLKQWLDDNLPVMVERLVRIEIERVARGGR
jgi:cell pole-organizing protein PopZ